MYLFFSKMYLFFFVTYMAHNFSVLFALCPRAKIRKIIAHDCLTHTRCPCGCCDLPREMRKK